MKSSWLFLSFVCVLIGLCSGPDPGAAFGQEEPPIEKGSETADKNQEEEELDAGIKEELAKADQLMASGKTAKAIKSVEELFEKTGHLRAGYALSQVYQLYALDLAKENHKKAHPVFLKGGELARKLLDDPEFPRSVRDEIVGAIYNEACSFAILNENEAALKTLGDLFRYGFEEFDKLENDPDLLKLTQTDGFRAVVTEARKAIQEKMDTESKKQIAAFKTFPFDFDQADLAERPLSLSALRGKVVIVDFWGTWCPPCRAEIPAFIKLRGTYSKDLEIVGLAYERGEAADAPQKVIAYGLKTNVNYPCAIGEQATKAMVPEFRGFPTTLFIDRAGKVRMVTVGAESYEKLESLVRVLMNEG